jgi:SH3-like domain-containing protein
MNDPLVHRLILLSCVLFGSAAIAEQMFVTDKLVLNVYAEPNQESERVATLETGDAIEVLEQAEDFLRVQLSDEREGWVDASYLTKDAPAIVRVRALEKENKTATQAVQKQHAEQRAQFEAENTELKTQVEALQKAAAVHTPAAAPLQASPPITSEAVHFESIANRIWGIWVLLIVAAAGLGYLTGYQTLARRIRNKFGGVKIY